MSEDTKPEAPADDVRPATIKAVTFLKHWCEATGIYPVLTALHLDPVTGVKGRIETQAFAADAAGTIHWAGVHAWIDQRQGKANIYFLVNAPIAPKNSKALKADMRAMVALHIDVDVRVGEDQVAGIARIINTFNTYKTPPTVITSSGGGAQAFWILREPVPIGGDVAKAEDAELYNIALARDLDGDKCHNVDRIMRVPGTINVPDSIKIKKGRKPALAHVISFTDTRYSIDAFAKAEAATDDKQVASVGTDEPKKRIQQVGPRRVGKINMPSELPVESLDDPRIAKLSVRGKLLMERGEKVEAEDNHDMSRSACLYSFVVECFRAEMSSPLIATIIMDARWPISASVLDKPNVNREVTRVLMRAAERANDPKLEEMNEAHHVVNLHGKTLVLSYDWNDAVFPGIPIPEYRTPSEFQSFYNKYQFEYTTVDKVGKEKIISIPLGTWWWTNPARRQYNGVVYAPNVDADEVGDRLNLWKGFAVQAKPGDKHTRFLEHLRDNICDGDPECFEYLLGWLAHRVQFPHLTPDVSIIQVGKRGTGKTIWVDMFGALFGRHFVTVVQHDHLTGKFNPHLQDCSVLHADECLNARDRKDEQILKALITGRTVRIEPKGVNSYEVPNHMGIIMSTNNKHAVPAGEQERRFFCLSVGDGRLQDTDYFNAMLDEMHNQGGFEHLLHFLKHRDISAFNIRKVPQTEELRRQKAMTRRGIDALIEQWCNDGVLPHAFHEDPSVVLTTMPEGDKGFFEWCMDHDPDLKYRGGSWIARELHDWGCLPWRRQKSGLRGLRFPPCPDLKATFEAKHGKQRWAKGVTDWERMMQPAGQGQGTGQQIGQQIGQDASRSGKPIGGQDKTALPF